MVNFNQWTCGERLSPYVKYWLPNHPILPVWREMAMNRPHIVLVLTGVLGVAPAAGESPIAISSQVETGWTSNATDSAVGGEDFYVRHSHDLSLTGGTDALVLRGSLAISQTRFAVTQFEDDAEVTGAIEAQLALGEAASLRLGYAVTQSWTGDDLSILGLVIPVQSAKTSHEYIAEYTLLGDDQQVTVGVTADWTLAGDSILEGLGLPPLQLSADVGSVTGRVAWERALSPSMALLTGMEAWFTLISEDDQLTYFRAPADGGRVAAGLRVVDGILSIEGMGGFDLVWPKGFSELIQTLPHVAVVASLGPMEGVTLALRAKTGVELADPLDAVAGRTVAVDLGATWALTPAVTLSAALSAEQEWGLFDQSVSRLVRTASLGARYAVSKQISYGATLSWSRHDDPTESYDKTGVAMSLTGAF